MTHSPSPYAEAPSSHPTATVRGVEDRSSRRPKRSRIELSVAMAAAIASAVALATPAAADAGATVKAKTQRMTQPNLNSQQNGWYTPGTRLTLVCSIRGQAVKGYFSFNIPNGGWDNLWYKTSDGHYVADVDIETGTLGVVAPDCASAGSPSPPPAAPSKADAAIAKAMSMVNTNNFGPRGCGKFVAAAYGVPGLGRDTALQFRNLLNSRGQIHMDTNIPRGALVFSQSKWDQGAGHVVIARGDGRFISGGVDNSYGTGYNVQVLNSWNPAQGAQYLGWANAPW